MSTLDIEKFKNTLEVRKRFSDAMRLKSMDYRTLIAGAVAMRHGGNTAKTNEDAWFFSFSLDAICAEIRLRPESVMDPPPENINHSDTSERVAGQLLRDIDWNDQAKRGEYLAADLQEFLLPA